LKLFLSRIVYRGLLKLVHKILDSLLVFSLHRFDVMVTLGGDIVQFLLVLHLQRG